LILPSAIAVGFRLRDGVLFWDYPVRAFTGDKAEQGRHAWPHRPSWCFDAPGYRILDDQQDPPLRLTVWLLEVKLTLPPQIARAVLSLAKVSVAVPPLIAVALLLVLEVSVTVLSLTPVRCCPLHP
jgi:hypothetical protein